MTIQRNADGWSSRIASDPLALFNFNDPINYPYFLDHFLAYDDTQAVGHPYTFTQTNGTDAILGPSGVLTLTCAGAANDLCQLQLTNAPWQSNSKRLWFEAKVKLVLDSGGTVAANELAVGLFSVQTGSNFFAADGLSLAADDALGFVSFDATATMNAVMRENDVQSSEAGIVTPVDDTWMRLSIYYDGGTAYFYKDGGLVATLTTVDATSVLTPTLYIKLGEAKGNALHCDYIFTGAEL